MKTASAKKKGRDFQKWVKDLILRVFRELEGDDVLWRSMGSQGEDIMLSPKARQLFPYSIECKHYKSFAIYQHYDQATENANGFEPILFIKGNNKKPLVVIDAEWFMKLVKFVKPEDYDRIK
jgi:hypothetical protein